MSQQPTPGVAIPTAIMGGTPLQREGLRQFLAGTLFEPSEERETGAAEPTLCRSGIRLHLLLGDPAIASDLIGSLKSRAQNKVVAIADLDDGALIEAMAAGADGVFSARIDRATLATLLARVVLGDVVYATRRIVDLLRSAVPMAPLKASRIASLTSRERAIASLLVRGASNKLIARHCQVSENTIKTQVHGLLLKLGVSTRTQAVLALLDS